MKKIALGSIAMLAVCMGAQAQKKAAPAKVAVKQVETGNILKNAKDSLGYAIGLNVAENMKHQGILDDVNPEMVKRALMDVRANQPKMDQQMAGMTLQQKLAEAVGKKAQAEKAKGQAFLKENAKNKDVTVLANGLQYKILRPGVGFKPTIDDTVVVHYAGRLINGEEFDNSQKRNAPATFPLRGVIKGWTEILQLMPKGSKWEVYIPSDLGYGDRGAGANIPGGSVLIFEIDLLDIKELAK